MSTPVHIPTPDVSSSWKSTLRRFLMEFGASFVADIAAFKIFGHHNKPDGEDTHEGAHHGSPGQEAGQKASKIAQETVLKSTARVRAEFKMLMLRLMAQADGKKAADSINRHQINRAEKRPKPYGPQPRENYGAAAETDMWRAFDSLKANLDDENMVAIMKYMGHLPAQKFDAEIESLIDNGIAQRASQVLEVVRRVGGSLDGVATKAASILGSVNDAAAETKLSKKGSGSDWIEDRIEALKARRKS